MSNKANRVTQLNLSALKATSPSTQNHDIPVSTHSTQRGKEAKLKGAIYKTASQPHSKIIKGKPRTLGLPGISKPTLQRDQEVLVRSESPWDTFNREYECDLAGIITVVTRRSGPRCVYSLRQFPGENPEHLLFHIRSIQHENVVSALEYFHAANTTYALAELFPITLEHVVACEAFPTQSQLTAIMVQVRL